MANAGDVRDILASVTGAPFRITEPRPNRLLLRQNSVWFVANLDIAYLDKSAHLDRAWQDKQGAVWLETSKVADMVALVEHAYGERGAASMPDVKPGIPPTRGIPKEVKGYPRVIRLLRAYDVTLARLSKEYGVELRTFYDGGVGVTTVRIGAKIESPSSDVETLRQQIAATEKVLKEAYRCILKS
jgi:hypothetical protein